MTSLGVVQPHFFPFPGFFDLMRRVDLFVYYDTVQFRRRSWQCRTLIRQGAEAVWWGIPVRTPDGRCPIAAVDVAADASWRSKAQRRIEAVYGACPAPLAALLADGPTGLADWNIAGIEWLRTELGITTPTVKASALAPTVGDGTEKLVQLCQQVGADRYLTTEGATGYLREADFAAVGVTVEWLDYAYPHRLPGPDGGQWFPSILDLLLTQGIERARAEVFCYAEGSAP